MAIPVRRRTAPNGRPAFSTRRTAVGFVLAALLLWGGGTALRAAWQSAVEHPAAAVVVAVVLLTATVALLRHRRHRRAARRATVAVTEVTYDLVDTGLSEMDAALRPEPAPEPVLEPVDYAVMDADEFEQAVAGLCERDGCRDVQVVGGAGDLGADVIATAPDGRRIVIQCKRYGPDNKVGSQDVQRFGGTCFVVHEADVALVVTTGVFTEPALDYADQCGIVCVDHEALGAWSDAYTPPPWGAALTVEDRSGGR